MTIGSSQSNQSTIRVVSGDNSSHPYQMAPLDTGAVAHNHSSPQLHITPSSPTNQTFHGTNWHYGSSGSSTYNTSGVSPGYLSDTPPLAPPSPICTRESDSIKSGKGSEKTAKRQFSFQSMFSRAHTHNRTASTESAHTIRRMGLGSRKGSRMDNLDGTSGVATNSGGSHRVGTEEELLGLVKGDTKRTVREDSLPPYTDGSDDEDRLVGKEKEKEIESYTMRRTSTPTSEEGYNDEKPDKGKRSEKSTIRLV